MNATARHNADVDCYTSINFAIIGGMLGFACSNGIGSVDDVKIRSYNASSSAFDIIEHYEQFGIDGSGNITETPTYDRNGNLTYDGLQQYTFDAWNRMMTAAHAYRDSSVSAGQTLDTMSYDGKGRRIKKVTSGTGQWDLTNQYYFDHDSVIEKRNGSDAAITQYVWGTRYIDELCQLLVESTFESDFGGLDLSLNVDSVYYTCQDSNYNVLGIVDTYAVLKERYAYTPYGQRKVFISPGANDLGAHAPIMASGRVDRDGTLQAYATCDIGHQGLMHDEELGLVYNRARMLVPEYGRFNGRDHSNASDFTGGLVGARRASRGHSNPWPYIDSVDLYEYELSSIQGWNDAIGLAANPCKNETTCWCCLVYAEARGENDACQQAVSRVVDNRTGPNKNLCDVVSEGNGTQFNGYTTDAYKNCCKDTCNFPNEDPPAKYEKAFRNCYARYPAGGEPDPSHGAKWFHDKSIDTPDWIKDAIRAGRMEEVFVEGCNAFQFYREKH